jgi:hypothetical protein
MKKRVRPNSLNENILNANPITKSSSMIAENVHGYYLQFLKSKVDQLLTLIILFQLRLDALQGVTIIPLWKHGVVDYIKVNLLEMITTDIEYMGWMPRKHIFIEVLV